jgi:hypothetical protein
MKGFKAFLLMAPDRVREVIESGPFPQMEYGNGGQKITARDKRMGIMRFKGGEGRGGIPMKHGQRGVVYYDPAFASEEYQFDDTPDAVLERHEREEYVKEFKKL